MKDMWMQFEDEYGEPPPSMEDVRIDIADFLGVSKREPITEELHPDLFSLGIDDSSQISFATLRELGCVKEFREFYRERHGFEPPEDDTEIDRAVFSFSKKISLKEVPTLVSREPSKEYDVFISYASEDRIEVAKPLADALIALGLEVWFDEHQLKLGNR